MRVAGGGVRVAGRAVRDSAGYIRTYEEQGAETPAGLRVDGQQVPVPLRELQGVSVEPAAAGGGGERARFPEQTQTGAKRPSGRPERNMEEVVRKADGLEGPTLV